MAPSPEPRDLGADEWLSQYGNRRNLTKDGLAFKHRPPKPEFGLSVLIGMWAPEVAALLVVPRLTVFKGTGVRHAQVGSFRDAGFVVIDAPTRGNPENHGRIKWPLTWDDVVDECFDGCFSEPVWWEESEG
jgi:hypothetical protein